MANANSSTVTGKMSIVDNKTNSVLHRFSDYAKREVTVQEGQISVHRPDTGVTTVVPVRDSVRVVPD